MQLLTPGTILLPAEGEGRNAVWAAKNGWNVIAFDYSKTARDKALLLAEEANVSIDYRVCDFEEFELSETVDCVAFIFTHFSPNVRRLYFKKATGFLRTGGTALAELFSKQQLGRQSGGPQQEDLLLGEEDLRSDFCEMVTRNIVHAEVDLDEGPFHHGLASVYRLIAVK